MPSEGNEELQLEVSDLLSSNDRGSVYAVTATNADSLPFCIPPLVIKVASEREGRKLAEEAGMYRDLESLQGVVTARCYGYFRAAVNHLETAIRPWDDFNAIDWPRTHDKLDIFRMPNPCASLNILLLERLGGVINTGWGASTREMT